MTYREIMIPTQPHMCRYLSEWPELLNQLPDQGKYILNKVQTGCGGTTLFLQSDLPLILVSPRSAMLYSKAGQFPNTHLFRRPNDTSSRNSVVNLKERLSNYINSCLNSIFMPAYAHVPKILVTIDSYKHVAEQLSYMGLLDKFHVVVDEFHCIMSDSRFKGRTELEFLSSLTGVRCVCYLSATPIPELYMSEIPEFQDVSEYIRLVWHPSVSETPNLDMRPYGKKENVGSLCRKIIEDYKSNGFFARKIVNGVVEKSKEVVIFVNDIRKIVEIIEDNSLNPSDVNVLCSQTNKSVPLLKKMGVMVNNLCTDPNNPVNPIFTFASSSSFEGVDFYSRSAFTYVFCDGVLDWYKHDLIIDVPQILGRQRLASNPFWKDAVLYYRADSRSDNEAIAERIKRKNDNTDRWIEQYDSCDFKTKLMLKNEVMKRAEKNRYKDDYVEFVDIPGGGFKVKKNELVMYTELRDYELSEYVYKNSITILSTLSSQNSMNIFNQFNVSSTATDPVVENFNKTFFGAGSFPDKMKAYIEVRKARPEYEATLKQNPFIDISFHQYYDLLGEETIGRLRYREQDIQEHFSALLKHGLIVEKCRQMFIPGQKYRLSKVKEILQGII